MSGQGSGEHENVLSTTQQSHLANTSCDTNDITILYRGSEHSYFDSTINGSFTRYLYKVRDECCKSFSCQIESIVLKEISLSQYITIACLSTLISRLNAMTSMDVFHKNAIPSSSNEMLGNLSQLCEVTSTTKQYNLRSYVQDRI